MNTPNSISSWSFFLVLLYILVGGFHFVGHFVDWFIYGLSFASVCGRVFEHVYFCMGTLLLSTHAPPPPHLANEMLVICYCDMRLHSVLTGILDMVMW